jgi:GxxExxY protein
MTGGATVQDEELTHKVIGCAMQVHTVLGPGYLESVYENALAHDLRKAGLRVEYQRPIRVWYDGVVVGDFVGDLWVEGRLIVENKAVQALVRAHEVQLVSYLNSTGVEVGLLLNFGAPSLQYKRKHRTYRPREIGQDLQDGQD